MKIGKPKLAPVEFTVQERVAIEQAATALKEYCNHITSYTDCAKLCPLYECCPKAQNRDTSSPDFPLLLGGLLNEDILYIPIDN